MSEYKKIDCVGWWECQPGHGGRIHVLLIDNGYAFGWRSLTKEKVVATASNIEVNFCKHLPDCTSWDWQPEPKIEEIDFPDWILPGWDFVTRDRNGVWVYQSTPQLDLQSGCWTFGDSHFSQKLNRAIDCSWVPDTDDWTKAVWQRKPKQDDGWIKWEGGLRPINELVSVNVKLRSGKTDSGSGYWRWLHTGKDDDIVAYRIIE